MLCVLAVAPLSRKDRRVCLSGYSEADPPRAHSSDLDCRDIVRHSEREILIHESKEVGHITRDCQSGPLFAVEVFRRKCWVQNRFDDADGFVVRRPVLASSECSVTVAPGFSMASVYKTAKLAPDCGF